MSEIIVFVEAHPLLCLAFVIVLVSLFKVESMVQRRKRFACSPESAVKLINHEKAEILDIRDAEPFSKAHIIHAKHTRPDALTETHRALKKSNKRPVILVCENGQHSVKLAARLRDEGHEKVWQLSGGLSAWVQAGLPVVAS